jgi:hypothetical protein
MILVLKKLRIIKNIRAQLKGPLAILNSSVVSIAATEISIWLFIPKGKF